MTWKENEANPFGEPLAPGDFVNVHLNADPSKGHEGFVIDADEDFVWIQVHQWLLPSGKHPTCANHRVVYPWRSVAFIAHVKVRPDDCLCAEAVGLS